MARKTQRRKPAPLASVRLSPPLPTSVPASIAPASIAPASIAPASIAPAQGMDLGPTVDGVAVASAYHLTLADQHRLAAAIYGAMRTSFQARWIELGLAHTPIPTTAAQRLQTDARAAAATAIRSHNTNVSRFISAWTVRYTQEHGSTRGAHAALIAALGKWLAARLRAQSDALGAMQTLSAHSLADLYSANPDDLFTVDGPALTDASCPTCVTYVGATLTTEKAWGLVFPAHPHCEHVIRRLTPAEMAQARATGRASLFSH